MFEAVAEFMKPIIILPTVLAAVLAGTLLFVGCATNGGNNSFTTDSSGSVKGATLLMKPYNSHHHPD